MGSVTALPQKDTDFGRITRLQTQARRPTRMSVFVDGEFAFGIHQDIALQFGLHVGLKMTSALKESALAAEAERKAGEVALRYLAYGPRSTREVRDKLRRAEFSEPVVELVTERLQSRGYLDDQAVARQYVRARFNHRSFGPHRLRADLRRRGFTDKHITAALDELCSEVDLEATATALAERRWPLLRGTEAQRRKKLLDWLFRRGYSYDIASKVLATLS